MSDFNTVRKAMFTERRKYYPPFPKSLNKAVTQLNEKQNANSLIYKGEKCIHITEYQLLYV